MTYIKWPNDPTSPLPDAPKWPNEMRSPVPYEPNWQNEAMRQNALLHSAMLGVARAEAKLAKAVDALRLVIDACDDGKIVLTGAVGVMNVYAQIRRSVYNQVPAWPIEEARTVLNELEEAE